MTRDELITALRQVIEECQYHLRRLGGGPGGVMASIEHLDFDVDSDLVRAFERRALSLVAVEAGLRYRARVAVFRFDSIARLCEQTPLDLLVLDGVGPISVCRLEQALAARGLYLAGTRP